VENWGKSRVGRSRHRREDDFKNVSSRNGMGRHELDLNGSEHGQMAAFVNAVMNFQVS